MAGLTADHTAFISVGSNMGDKLDNCMKGIDALISPGVARLTGISAFYRTSPVDYTDQDWFVNAAIRIATPLEPPPLLERLTAIQRQMGRKTDAVRFGPRMLDLDILLYDDRIIRSAQLEIPHPRMHKRAFVLRPICDIEPTVVHPLLGKRMSELLEALDAADQQVILMEPQPVKGGLP